MTSCTFVPKMPLELSLESTICLSPRAETGVPQPGETITFVYFLSSRPQETAMQSLAGSCQSNINLGPLPSSGLCPESLLHFSMA